MEKLKLCERNEDLKTETLYAAYDADVQGWRLMKVTTEYINGRVYTELKDLLASTPWDVSTKYVKSQSVKEIQRDEN